MANLDTVFNGFEKQFKKGNDIVDEGLAKLTRAELTAFHEKNITTKASRHKVQTPGHLKIFKPQETIDSVELL